jgi:hypothetical protein
VSRIKAAKETVAAARSLQEALLRMRRALGVPATAGVCEKHAQELLGGNNQAAALTAAEKRSVSKRLSRHPHLLDKIVTVLGDRTLHCTEIHSALLAAGVEDHPSLAKYVNSTLGKNTGPHGKQLFVKVKMGWFCARKRNEPVENYLRLSKGELVCAIYDAIGKDSLTKLEICGRLLERKLLPVERCQPDRVMATISNNYSHSTTGSRCFSRDKKDNSRIVAVPGKRPVVDTPETVTLQHICMMFRGAPLSDTEIHERLTKHNQLSLKYVQTLLARNTDGLGQRLFERVSPRIYRLANHVVVMDLVLQVLGDQSLSSPAIASRICELGHLVSTGQVYGVLRKNSGFGMRFVCVSKGVYAKNPEYR